MITQQSIYKEVGITKARITNEQSAFEQICTPSVSYYKSFDFFTSQTLSLTKIIEKFSKYQISFIKSNIEYILKILLRNRFFFINLVKLEEVLLGKMSNDL